MGGGMVGQKASAFGPSAKRLVRRMAPAAHQGHRWSCVLAVVSVALMSIGPRILGRATDLIFAGVLGKDLGPRCRPARPRSEAVAPLQRSGDDKQADRSPR